MHILQYSFKINTWNKAAKLILISLSKVRSVKIILDRISIYKLANVCFKETVSTGLFI